MTVAGTGGSLVDRRYAGYIFDLDGTVYLGDELLPGIGSMMAGLRAEGARVLFLSNNPTKDRAMYSDKLTRLGIPARPDEVLNTVVTMTAWLQAHRREAGIFVIGEQPLIRALAGVGLRLTDDPEQIDVVVASYDRTFEYRKLQIAFDALAVHRRAELVTTNPDVYCPFPGGRGEPDAGALVAAIEACTGVVCSVNTGKPDPIMLDTAMDILDLPVTDCLMVGDRLSTDIEMALRAGMDSALVLTGEATAATVLDETRGPTWVLDSAARLAG